MIYFVTDNSDVLGTRDTTGDLIWVHGFGFWGSPTRGDAALENEARFMCTHGDSNSYCHTIMADLAGGMYVS